MSYHSQQQPKPPFEPLIHINLNVILIHVTPMNSINVFCGLY